jgi:hypothetical protein
MQYFFNVVLKLNAISVVRLFEVIKIECKNAPAVCKHWEYNLKTDGAQLLRYVITTEKCIKYSLCRYNADYDF